jgi:phenylpyruvate tautomerase PptA (4-oxalocrotonate tautomerase family)
MPDYVRIKLMKKLTEVSVDIKEILEESFWVFVKELGPDSTMISGKTLVEVIKEHQVK